MLRLTFLLACFLTLWTTSVTAQGSDAVLKVQNEPLPQVLRQLEERATIREARLLLVLFQSAINLQQMGMGQHP